MRIAVCDDDRAVREELLRMIKKQMPEADIVEYQSGEEMINAGGSFDISFLDIEMGKVSGMDIARRIREQEEGSTQRSIIIFVTGYREYMEAAFDVNAFHYLIKSIDAEKFSEVFCRAWKEASAFLEQTKKHIMVKCSGTQRKILLKDIYYIESGNKKVIFHTTGGILEVYGKMEELESYIGKMEETVGKLNFAYQTGNPITDIIIHQKGQEAEKKQIRFQVDFAYPPKLLIDVYDIAVILNNALENAIEACCKAEGEKQISLYSYVKGSLFFVEVENDFSGEIVMEEETGLPASSKETGKLHGIGISNIQRCAKKYMGDIDIVISDKGSRKKFILTVMMNGKTAAES